MYKLVFFVPESHADAVKAAIFAAGAGSVGNYDQCCWQTSGIGQFRPLAGSDPFIGEQDALTQLVEIRVETICKDQHISDVLKVLRAAHPYEEPAIDVWQLAGPEL